MTSMPSVCFGSSEDAWLGIDRQNKGIVALAAVNLKRVVPLAGRDEIALAARSVVNRQPLDVLDQAVFPDPGDPLPFEVVVGLSAVFQIPEVFLET